MPAVVRVKNVETAEDLNALIEERFQQERYPEITQAIGIHSVLITSEHMLEDQAIFYRRVLELLKNRIKTKLGKQYAAWYKRFPEYVGTGKIDFDKTASEMIESHLAAAGSFRSLDDFFFWALDDRRLDLGQIVRFVEKTAAEFRQA